MKKYIVEAIGTFTLALVVSLSLQGNFPVSTPVLAGLVLGLFVYSIGHISGSHINPAVTLGLLSIKKIKLNESLFYIVAQFVGAFVALQVVGSPNISVIISTKVFLAELVGMFFFAFGIASVVYGRANQISSGLVVGGSLLLGITISALLGSNGILNPAVALTLGSLNLLYIFGPIIGSVFGFMVYQKLSE